MEECKFNESYLLSSERIQKFNVKSSSKLTTTYAELKTVKEGRGLMKKRGRAPKLSEPLQTNKDKVMYEFYGGRLLSSKLRGDIIVKTIFRKMRKYYLLEFYA